MSLSRAQVQKAIEIVAADPASTSRIQSSFAALGRGAGFTRNMVMALGFGIAKLPHDALLEAGRRGGVPPWTLARMRAEREIPLDPNRPGTMGYELQCTEIAIKAAEAIERKKSEIQGLVSASQCDRSKGFAHAGVKLVMSGGAKKSNYVLDWWATLEVWDPLVYRFDDFDQARFRSGTKFGSFYGYD